MRQGKYSLVLVALPVILSGCASSGAKTAQIEATKPQTKPVQAKALTKQAAKESDNVASVNVSGPVNTVGSEPRLLPKVAFSSATDGNVPSRIHDDDLTTRWSSKGKDAWIVLDYGKVVEFDAVRIAFYKGDQRASRFMVQASKDGRKWVDVVPKTASSGKSTGYERYPFKATKARYIKYVGYGNTKNIWNSILELNAVNCTVNTCLASEFIRAN